MSQDGQDVPPAVAAIPIALATLDRQRQTHISAALGALLSAQPEHASACVQSILDQVTNTVSQKSSGNETVERGVVLLRAVAMAALHSDFAVVHGARFNTLLRQLYAEQEWKLLVA